MNAETVKKLRDDLVLLYNDPDFWYAFADAKEPLATRVQDDMMFIIDDVLPIAHKHAKG